MSHCYVTEMTETTTPITPILTDQFDDWLDEQPAEIENWVVQTGFKAKPGQVCTLPDKIGDFHHALVGVKDLNDMWSFAGLPFSLPPRNYYLDVELDDYLLQQMIIAWGLGAYQFTRYKNPEKFPGRLYIPKNSDLATIENVVTAIYFVRDLINMPSDDMTPYDLSDVSGILAEQFCATITHVADDSALLKKYPATFMVGRGSGCQSQVIDLIWGEESAPKVTLIGKGVCFDSGGLILKTPAGMKSMKKDMAGAAHVLGLARMIMAANLPIRLRVIIPAVENSVSSDAYHPGDIITYRNGKTVEVTNTDAEGRLILADALIEAGTDNPELIIDFATLTGAAVVALGDELPAMFVNNEELAQDVKAFAAQEQDPVWRLPLYGAYRDMLKSDIADLVNSTEKRGAGAITAALFLQEFVAPNIPWLHFDIMAWNDETKPGKPKGADAVLLRTLFSYLRQRYSARH
jgi:leucyl aminopeptidase